MRLHWGMHPRVTFPLQPRMMLSVPFPQSCPQTNPTLTTLSLQHTHVHHPCDALEAVSPTGILWLAGCNAWYWLPVWPCDHFLSHALSPWCLHELVLCYWGFQSPKQKARQTSFLCTFSIQVFCYSDERLTDNTYKAGISTWAARLQLAPSVIRLFCSLSSWLCTRRLQTFLNQLIFKKSAFIYWFIWEAAREGKSSHSLIHSVNAYNGLDWTVCISNPSLDRNLTT